MAKRASRARAAGFKIGDHVSWNSEAGRVRGIIRKKISAPVMFTGYTVRATREEPQYLIESAVAAAATADRMRSSAR